jgi:hypothetical protein
MSEELRPCPFCGGEAELCYSEVDTFCRKCNVMQETELWNTRPIEDALRLRITELEAENEKIDYFFRKLRMFCIFAHWDNPNTEAEFYKVDAEIREYLSEYKVCIDQLTAHSDIERQDDKWIPEVK